MKIKRRAAHLIVALSGLSTMLFLPVPSFAQPTQPAAVAKADAKNIAGAWQGALEMGAVMLRLSFNIAAQPGGGFSGTLDSLDQGVRGMTVDAVMLQGDKVVVELHAIGGRFEGTLSADGQQIKGEWKQGPGTMPLLLKRGAPPEIRRPQEPQKPYPYDEREVTVASARPGVTLAGTLSLPRAMPSVAQGAKATLPVAPPFPVVLLLAGSGPHTRDQNVFNHKTLLVIGDYLTRRGIAVLRMDKRGIGASKGDFSKASLDDFAADALSAIAFLKTQPEIDARRIGLIGHSEGGLLAPLVASQSPDISFIVLLAGTGQRGEDVLLTQSELIARAGGASERMVDLNRRIQQRTFELLRDETNNGVVERELRAMLPNELNKMTPEERQQIGDPEVLMQRMSIMLTPWFRSFLALDPAVALKKVRCPILALDGEHDLQVDARANLPLIEAALKAGGNTDVTATVLPGLNHLFQTSKTGAPTEYGTIEETFAPAALKIIGDWIAAHTQPKRDAAPPAVPPAVPPAATTKQAAKP